MADGAGSAGAGPWVGGPDGAAVAACCCSPATAAALASGSPERMSWRNGAASAADDHLDAAVDVDHRSGWFPAGEGGPGRVGDRLLKGGVTAGPGRLDAQPGIRLVELGVVGLRVDQHVHHVAPVGLLEVERQVRGLQHGPERRLPRDGDVGRPLPEDTGTDAPVAGLRVLVDDGRLALLQVLLPEHGAALRGRPGSHPAGGGRPGYRRRCPATPQPQSCRAARTGSGLKVRVELPRACQTLRTASPGVRGAVIPWR